MEKQDNIEKLRAAIKAREELLEPWEKAQADEEILDEIDAQTPFNEDKHGGKHNTETETADCEKAEDFGDYSDIA